MTDAAALAFGIVIVLALAAAVLGGLVFVTRSWSETFAHGAALRGAVRREGKGNE